MSNLLCIYYTQLFKQILNLNPPQNKYNLRNDKIRDTQMSSDQAQQNWSTIRDAIHKIYAKQASTLSYEELYRTAYNLVLHKHGEILYQGVRNTTIELLQPIVQRLSRCSDEDLIKKINQVWAEVKLSIIMIKDILMYMDKNYVPKVKLQSVEHLQTQCFQKHVVLNPEIKSKLISIIMNEIKRERDGQKVETTQLRQIIQMLVEVGISSKKIYENEFEKVFVNETQNYYRVESNQYITSHSCYAFLQKANMRLNEELERVLNYLDSSSERILIQTFLKEYIEQHSLSLINMEHSGLIHMIKNEKYHEIALMHDLFSKVPDALVHLTKQLALYIINEGNKLVNDETMKHDQFVAKIIDLREKMINMFSRSFNKDAAIDLAIKNAFESFINQSEKTAMNDQFKKDFKGMGEAEINERLDKVIQIFRYLQDKDIFEGFYKNSLAKRLLDQRNSTSDEQERQLVLKLKEECGFQYTQKLEVMFKDIKMSEETMLEFRGTQLSKSLQIELSVKVNLQSYNQIVKCFIYDLLTTGNWPNEAKDNIATITLPKEIQSCIQNFNKYYNNKHTGRLLHWKPSLAFAEIRATLGESNSKYELQSSTFQSCILILFNQYQQICEKTNIPDKDLKCNLIPLIGIKMLKKTPDIKEFNANDVITLNPSFKSGSHKIKLPVAQLKEKKEAEKAEITEKVDEDRRHMVEATIVKVMKTRRRIEHNALLTECTKILAQKFNPDLVMIKKRIESLIDREYLERDSEDRRFKAQYYKISQSIKYIDY